MGQFCNYVDLVRLLDDDGLLFWPTFLFGTRQRLLFFWGKARGGNRLSELLGMESMGAGEGGFLGVRKGRRMSLAL